MRTALIAPARRATPIAARGAAGASARLREPGPALSTGPPPPAQHVALPEIIRLSRQLLTVRLPHRPSAPREICGGARDPKARDLRGRARVEGPVGLRDRWEPARPQGREAHRRVARFEWAREIRRVTETQAARGVARFEGGARFEGCHRPERHEGARETGGASKTRALKGSRYLRGRARTEGARVEGPVGLRNRLALYVYEYLLHVGAQKSAQTFLSEIRWEKNITLGEPPGFLHSWWCVFWDLYCAAPDRREACEHSSEAKAFQDYSAAAAPSPVMGSMAPNDAMAAGPMATSFFQPFMSPRFPGGPRPTLRMPSQPPMGLPGSQPLLPGAMDPSPRAQGHPSLGGPMQRVTPPRGLASVGPQSYGGGMRPPPNSLAGPGLPAMNMGPGVRGPWASPSGNSITYSSSSPGGYTGPPGGGGPPGTPIMPSPGDSTTSSENMYTIMNPIVPGAGRASFPLGAGPEGPVATMSAMEPHHVNGSLGSGDMDGLPKYSPGMTMSV
ncbi:PREDICTED: single-stranded DNA-binding protein 4 [Galeopterus variegatus]|uniref:Single-stranded DNA-binding protein 4 n=1 Tax=Galeopterus variegatus TaxID=482537 RepID=A0ABM0S7Z7_GALVR|nr:PREDICTED: single-stranded DNA-binding protein 4 [Galeopterus variegatus]